MTNSKLPILEKKIAISIMKKDKILPVHLQITSYLAILINDYAIRPLSREISSPIVIWNSQDCSSLHASPAFQRLRRNKSKLPMLAKPFRRAHDSRKETEECQGGKKLAKHVAFRSDSSGYGDSTSLR